MPKYYDGRLSNMGKAEEEDEGRKYHDQYKDWTEEDFAAYEKKREAVEEEVNDALKTGERPKSIAAQIKYDHIKSMERYPRGNWTGGSKRRGTKRRGPKRRGLLGGDYYYNDLTEADAAAYEKKREAVEEEVNEALKKGERPKSIAAQVKYDHIKSVAHYPRGNWTGGSKRRGTKRRGTKRRGTKRRGAKRRGAKRR